MFKVYPKAQWTVETMERRYGFKNFKEVRERMKEFNIVDLVD